MTLKTTLSVGLFSLASFAFETNTFAQIAKDTLNKQQNYKDTTNYVNQNGKDTTQITKENLQKDTNSVDINSQIAALKNKKAWWFKQYDFYVAQKPNYDSVTYVKKEIYFLRSKIDYLTNIALALGNNEVKDSSIVDYYKVIDQTIAASVDINSQIAALENKKAWWFKQYDFYVAQKPFNYDSVTYVKTEISILQSKIDYLTNIALALGNNEVKDSSIVVYCKVIDQTKDQVLALEASKKDLLAYYAKLVNATPVDTALVYQVKYKIANIDETIAKLLNTNNFTDTTKDFSTSDSLYIVKEQVVDLDTKKDSLYTLYNNLVQQQVNYDSIIALKKQILLLEKKLYNVDSSAIVVEKKDVTYWSQKETKDTVVNNEIKFVWEVTNFKDKYEFQLSKDPNFENIDTTITNLEDGFVTFDINYLKEKGNDSTKVITKNARVSANTQIYWRVGVNADANTLWSAPKTLDVAKLTGLENVAQVSVGVYPNPAQNQITINASSEVIAVNIHNLQGTLVNSFGNQTAYNVSDLKAGIYFLTVTTANGVATSKLVKE